MDRVYFNDEWNEPKSTYDKDIKQYQVYKRESTKEFDKNTKRKTK